MHSLAETLTRHPPSKTALIFGNQSWTYAALNTWIEAETAYLAANGITKGDRVAVLALNHPRTLALLFACNRLGAILCPLNWRLAPPERDWILSNATPKLLITDLPPEGAPSTHDYKTVPLLPLPPQPKAKAKRPSRPPPSSWSTPAAPPAAPKAPS